MSGMYDLVTREALLVAEFITLLGDEQAVLANGDTEGLADLAGRKSELAGRLNAVDAERNAVLAGAGYPMGRSGMSQWLAATGDESGKLATAWEELLARAKDAQAMNDLNGKLIAIRMQATGDAIGVLTQRAAGDTLYGRDGQTAGQTGSRIIDSA